MTAQLTLVRQAIWNAIETWPGLADATTETGRAFRQTLRFDAEQPLMTDVQPASFDLPAISVLPGDFQPAWHSQQTQHWPVVFDIRIWTPGWALPPAESLIEQTILSCFQAGAGGGLSYIKAATGFHPRQVGPVRIEFVRLGNSQPAPATLAQCQVAVRLPFAPLGP